MKSDATRPNIIIIQNQLGDLGGVSRFCAILSSGLHKRGYHVEIAAVHRPVEPGAVEYSPEIRTHLFTENIPPSEEQYAGFLGPSRLKRARAAFKDEAYRGAKRFFSKVHAHSIVIFTQLYAKEITRDITHPINRMNAYRVISQYHGSFEAARRGSDFQRAVDAYKDDDLFLLLTQADASRFQQAGFNNTSYILNPLERDPTADASSLTAKKVVSLGRYNSQKSLDHLISAWKMLAQDFPDWKLELYGSGPLEQDLADQIVELELADSVSLMGPTDSPIEVLKNASVNAQSSQFEGLPLALMEASLAGVPSVAYDCAPGIGEIISHGKTGYLVRQNRVVDLAAAIASLIEDSAKRVEFGRAARRHVAEKFSLESILREWEETFDIVQR